MNGQQQRSHRLTKNKQCFMMPARTRDFLQKICYKKTASVDMTNYGFINDSKVNPVNLLMKPLREKLENICETNRISSPKEKAVIRNKEKVVSAGTRKPAGAQAPDSKLKLQKPQVQNKVTTEPKKIKIEDPRKRRVQYEDQQRPKLKKIL